MKLFVLQRRCDNSFLDLVPCRIDRKHCRIRVEYSIQYCSSMIGARLGTVTETGKCNLCTTLYCTVYRSAVSNDTFQGTVSCTDSRKGKCCGWAGELQERWANMGPQSDLLKPLAFALWRYNVQYSTNRTVGVLN